MTIDIIGTVIAIIAGLLTIIEFFKPNSNAKVQQHNKNGINYYADNSTHVNNTTNKTTHINNSNTNNSNAEVEITIAFLIGLLTLAIMLTFYSITYKLMPLICIILLTINIYRGTKVSFENKKAKIQWGLKNLFLLIVVTILLITPKSILNIIAQIPAFQYDNFYDVLDSLIFNIKFIFGLYQESLLLAFNLVGRIIVTIGLLINLLISTFTKTSSHKTHSNKDLISFLILALLMLFGTNIEFIWNYIEPIRHSIENWFSPPQ